MFHLTNDMHTSAGEAFIKVAHNRFIAHAVKAARSHVLAGKRLALAWDDGIPTLDTRNEQDNDKRGESEDTSRDDNGFAVPMTSIQRAGILAGLATYAAAEHQAYTSDEFGMQTYENYIDFMRKLDKPFDVNSFEAESNKELVAAGLLTEEDIDQDRKSQVEKLAAPFKQYGAEILGVCKNLGNVEDKDGFLADPDDSWMVRLPYWEQLQLIEEVGDGMLKQARAKALRSRRPFPGETREELVADAMIIQKEAELVKKYRIQWYKENKQHLDREQEEIAARRAPAALKAVA